MSDNTTELDFGTTAQKATDGEKLPVVLLALDQGRYDMTRSLDELRALADANGMDAVAEVVQKRATPEAATMLGEGKVAEARLVCQNVNAAAAIYDGELTGSQIRNLSAALQLEVLDRTMLILEIFRARATSNEGKLQTELATLRYQLPRLQGLGESLSRQGGGGGGGGGARRGAGETKLELDRRHLHHRIEHLEEKLKEMEKRRGETRRARQKNNVPVVALVGYTNVGKSSLLNALCGEQIFEADMLFATLDPTARKLVLPSGLQIILVDTVGFVSRLPHHLVEAFKSTLEEVAEADVILHVVDGSHPDPFSQVDAVNDVLADIEGTASIPRILVFNKADQADEATRERLAALQPDAFIVSAYTGEGLDELRTAVESLLPVPHVHVNALLPYTAGSLISRVREYGKVDKVEYRDDGIQLEADVDAHLAAQVVEQSID